MATGIYSWSQTAATNSTADSTINWAEGQAPSTVNDSSRAEMAILAKWRDDMSGVQPSNAVQTSAGTANAQTLTTNGSIAALTNGWTVVFKAGAGLTNTAAVTLAVDSLTAKAIQKISGTALVGGEIVAGSVYTVTYHQPADSWVLHSAAYTATEGSWTPALAFGGATTGITYGTQVGRYVKTGPLVTVWGTVVITADGSASGSMTITGLPFTSSTVASLRYSGSIGWLENTDTVANVGWYMYVASASAVISILRGSDSNTSDLIEVTEGDVGDDWEISFSVTYRTG